MRRYVWLGGVSLMAVALTIVAVSDYTNRNPDSTLAQWFGKGNAPVLAVPGDKPDEPQAPAVDNTPVVVIDLSGQPTVDPKTLEQLKMISGRDEAACKQEEEIIKKLHESIFGTPQFPKYDFGDEKKPLFDEFTPKQMPYADEDEDDDCCCRRAAKAKPLAIEKIPCMPLEVPIHVREICNGEFFELLRTKYAVKEGRSSEVYQAVAMALFRAKIAAARIKAGEILAEPVKKPVDVIDGPPESRIEIIPVKPEPVEEIELLPVLPAPHFKPVPPPPSPANDLNIPINVSSFGSRGIPPFGGFPSKVGKTAESTAKAAVSAATPNYSGKNSHLENEIVGLTPTGTFTTDLDIPITVSSFNRWPPKSEMETRILRVTRQAVLEAMQKTSTPQSAAPIPLPRDANPMEPVIELLPVFPSPVLPPAKKGDHIARKVSVDFDWRDCFDAGCHPFLSFVEGWMYGSVYTFPYPGYLLRTHPCEPETCASKPATVLPICEHVRHMPASIFGPGKCRLCLMNGNPACCLKPQTEIGEGKFRLPYPGQMDDRFAIRCFPTDRVSVIIEVGESFKFDLKRVPIQCTHDASKCARFQFEKNGREFQVTGLRAGECQYVLWFEETEPKQLKSFTVMVCVEESKAGATSQPTAGSGPATTGTTTSASEPLPYYYPTPLPTTPAPVAPKATYPTPGTVVPLSPSSTPPGTSPSPSPLPSPMPGPAKPPPPPVVAKPSTAIKVYTVDNLLVADGDCANGKDEVAALIKLVKLVDTASWECNGGHAAVEFFKAGKAVVVKQTAENHKQIAVLLEELEKTTKKKSDPSKSSPNADSDYDVLKWKTASYKHREPPPGVRLEPETCDAIGTAVGQVWLKFVSGFVVGLGGEANLELSVDENGKPNLNFGIGFKSKDVDAEEPKTKQFIEPGRCKPNPSSLAQPRPPLKLVRKVYYIDPEFGREFNPIIVGWVAPDTWDGQRKAAYIEQWNMLIVMQTEEVHEDLQRFLDEMHEGLRRKKAYRENLSQKPVTGCGGDTRIEEEGLGVWRKSQRDAPHLTRGEVVGGVNLTPDPRCTNDWYNNWLSGGKDMKAPPEKECCKSECSKPTVSRKCYAVGDLIKTETGSNQMMPEDFIKLVAKVVAPESWECEAGFAKGRCGIEYFDPAVCLIVQQTEAGHADVKKFLDELREMMPNKDAIRKNFMRRVREVERELQQTFPSSEITIEYKDGIVLVSMLAEEPRDCRDVYRIVESAFSINFSWEPRANIKMNPRPYPSKPAEECILIQTRIVELDREALVKWCVECWMSNDPVATATATRVAQRILCCGKDQPPLSTVELEWLLAVLQESKFTTVLSCPKLITLNGQKATVQIGQAIPVRVDGGAEKVELETRTSGIMFNCCPELTRDGKIEIWADGELSFPRMGDMGVAEEMIVAKFGCKAAVAGGDTMVIPVEVKAGKTAKHFVIFMTPEKVRQPDVVAPQPLKCVPAPELVPPKRQPVPTPLKQPTPLNEADEESFSLVPTRNVRTSFHIIGYSLLSNGDSDVQPLTAALRIELAPLEPKLGFPKLFMTWDEQMRFAKRWNGSGTILGSPWEEWPDSETIKFNEAEWLLDFAAFVRLEPLPRTEFGFADSAVADPVWHDKYESMIASEVQAACPMWNFGIMDACERGTLCPSPWLKQLNSLISEPLPIKCRVYRLPVRGCDPDVEFFALEDSHCELLRDLFRDEWIPRIYHDDEPAFVPPKVIPWNESYPPESTGCMMITHIQWPSIIVIPKPANSQPTQPRRELPTPEKLPDLYHPPFPDDFFGPVYCPSPKDGVKPLEDAEFLGPNYGPEWCGIGPEWR